MQQALIALSLRRGYDGLTIKDICAEANVGRSTFYAHFTSKDDLKRSGLEDLHAVLSAHQRAAAVSGKKQPFSFSLPLFQHARDHRDLTRALAGSHGGAIGLNMVRRMVATLMRAEASRAADPAIPRELVVQFLTGAFMGVLMWWLERGGKLSAEQADAAFRRLAAKGFSVQPG